MGHSRIKGRILTAAIQLFGKFGFQGVNTRSIAKMAQCMEGGIYRLFGDKARLYDEAIASVVQASVNSMAEFALKLYTDKNEKSSQAEIITAAVHRWYSSISLDGAKLLQQVLLNDKQHKVYAEQPMANVLAIVQETLEPNLEGAGKRFDSKTRTECLIWALFQLKLSYAGPAEKEKQDVDRFLRDWLQAVSAGGKPRYLAPAGQSS